MSDEVYAALLYAGAALIALGIVGLIAYFSPVSGDGKRSDQ